MDVSYIDLQARVLNYFYRSLNQLSISQDFEKSEFGNRVGNVCPKLLEILQLKDGTCA